MSGAARRTGAARRGIVVALLFGGLFAAVWFALGRADEQRAHGVLGPDARAAAVEAPRGRLAPPETPDRPHADAHRSAAVPTVVPVHADTIRLDVVDAITGRALADVRVQRAPLASPPATDAAPRGADDPGEADDWTLLTTHRRAPTTVTARLPVVAAGASPLEVRVSPGSDLFITADGHGHARIAILRACPERVTVRMQPSTRLEVVIDEPADYTSMLVTLTRDGEGPAYRERRSARNGHAYFTDLRPGMFRIVADGVRRTGDVERAVQRIEVFPGERRVERLDFQPRYGELSLRLLEPVVIQGGSAFTHVVIQSLDERADSPERWNRVTAWVHESTSRGDRVHETEAPLRLPVGRTQLTVMPHGTRLHVELAANTISRVDEALPALARRRIVVTDVLSGEPVGCTIRLDLFEGLEGGSSLTVGFLQSDRETGVVESWFPDARFRLSPDETDLLFDSTRFEWENGAAMPEELALQGRRPEAPDRESWDSPELRDLMQCAFQEREANVQPGR